MALLEREKRLRYLDLTERDVMLLRALRPLFESHAAATVDTLCERLLAFPETAQILRDRTTTERLKQAQRNYLMRIVEGNFDDAYFAERRRMGQTHERMDLPLQFFLIGFSFYFDLFTPLIRDFLANDPARCQETVVALQKALMLDVSVAADAFIVSDRYRHLQRLDSIMKDSADVIFLLDTEKRFTHWNPAAEQVFGWREEEVLGKPVTLIIPPEVLQSGELERIDSAIAQRGHCHLETTRLARDGRRVPVELTLSQLRDQQKQPMGRSVILRDITERKRQEESKLQSERLAVIGTMSAKLAHEIRNPLSSILLNLDLVRDEVAALAKGGGHSPSEFHTLLRAMDSEVRRIERVTEDYLKFARLPKPQRERIPLNEVIVQGLAFMQSSFESAGVKLQTEFDPSLPPVRGDEGQLWQAVLNVIRNALEAMPHGGALTLRTFRAAGENVLQIADTGHGMAEEQRQKVFKPFFTTKTGGTGLGLPLTQQIIAEHGGHIECESVVGQGTTFTLHLPQATDN
ncbi:MAG: PAS domain S-box protein [Verrucomicrobia bacterium]|nr:PAS domain S-box protein [Verrucomicrobiota bacterium]